MTTNLTGVFIHWNRRANGWGLALHLGASKSVTQHIPPNLPARELAGKFRELAMALEAIADEGEKGGEA